MTAPAPLSSRTSTGSLTEGLATAHLSSPPDSETVVTDSTKATIGKGSILEADMQQGEASATVNNIGEEKMDYALEKRGPFYILPKCKLPPSHEIQPVETFVANAVKERTEQMMMTTAGKQAASPLPKTYRAIVGAMKQREDIPMLTKIFLAIRTAGNGSTLHQLSGNPSKHAQLMHILLRFNPFLPNNGTQQQQQTPRSKDQTKKQELENADNTQSRTDDYAMADAYFHLVLALVSANSVFVVPAMTSLWKLLTAYSGEDPPAARTQRLHATLAEMTRLCPKGTREIFSIMTMHFPFRTKPINELVWCYRQAFAVVEYVPSIYNQLLQFVIDKCLEMDVEIKIDDVGEVTIEDGDDDNNNKNSETEGIFDMELNDDASSRQRLKRARTGSISVNEMADKLDAVMLLTFQFFEKEGKHSVLDSRKLYERCYPAFESSILIAHRSKFVQFILFFLCGLENKALAFQHVGDELNQQQHATLYREFVAKLLELVMDPFRPSNVRQCAACYLASFISRARYVGADTICECLCALLHWSETYIATLPSISVAASDVRNQSDLHSLFYTICQAAFYIMCFRGAEAVEFFREIEKREKTQTGSSSGAHSLYDDVELHLVDISPERWARICGHALQPLRFCLETVRVEFLHVAERFALLDATLLQRISNEQNQNSSVPRKKRASLILTPATLEITRMKGGVGGLGRGSNPLDSFFPFDPYLLRRSHEYIEPLYRHWGEDNDENNDGDDSVDMQEEEEEDDQSQGTDVSDLDDSSTSSGAEENFRNSYDEEPTMALSTPAKHPTPREPWTETLKRNRAPSIDSGAGSW